jgi:hypothetical protein
MVFDEIWYYEKNCSGTELILEHLSANIIRALHAVTLKITKLHKRYSWFQK